MKKVRIALVTAIAAGAIALTAIPSGPPRVVSQTRLDSGTVITHYSDGSRGAGGNWGD